MALALRSCASKCALVAGTLAAAVPAPVAACSPSATVVSPIGDPPDNRRKCNKALRNVERYAARIAQQRVSREAAEQMADDLTSGASQCPKDQAAAFQIYDAIAGYPSLDDPESINARRLIRSLANLADHAPTKGRGQEVQALHWLVNGGFTNSPPEGFSEAQLTELLTRPHYFDHAVKQFRSSPRTTFLTDRLLLNPQSPFFDIDTAVDRTFSVQDRYARTALAIRLDDPKFGKPNYDRFAQLLSDYDPYHRKGLSEEMHRKAGALWVRISQSRLSSQNPEIKRRAEIALRTGDPTLAEDVVQSPQVKTGAQVLQLNEWPAGTEPLKNTTRWAKRVADNYPSRALRLEMAGRVELGVVFDPSGNFHSLQVTRSAGEILDRAAKKSIERYTRPRLKDMKLNGYEGQYVYAPLPSIEYHIGKRGPDFSGLVDPQTIIAAANLRPRTSCSW